MALRDAGHWGWVVDDRWRLVYVTDDLRLTFGGYVELARFAIGEHFFGPESVRATEEWRFGMTSTELIRVTFAGLGSYVLADTPGGHDELRELVDPSLRDVVDELSRAHPRDQRARARDHRALQDARSLAPRDRRLRAAQRGQDRG